MDDILILSKDGKTVKGVKDKFVTEIVIPQGVTTIGETAFEDCFNLSVIELPDTLTTIEGGAFWQCNLKEIYLPDSIATIGDSAFFNNQELRYIKLPKNLKKIDVLTFSGCSSLTEIRLIGHFGW